MIPEFPEFKSIELSDKTEIESFTAQFPPYSDFNFVSMWSWDTKQELRISMLNNNLVVRFCDYLTEKPFYSFIGITNVTETANTLIAVSVQEGLEPVLKLVPEVTAKNLDTNILVVKEDRNHFDYLFDTTDLSNLAHSNYYMQRKHARYFQKKFTHELREHTSVTPELQQQLLRLYTTWQEKKNNTGQHTKSEQVALARLLQHAEHFNLFILAVYKDDAIIAAAISGSIDADMHVSHFQKYDKDFKGISAYLNRQVGKSLLNKGLRYINWEQDLGIEGLRQHKLSYIPAQYLKKYIVTPR